MQLSIHLFIYLAVLSLICWSLAPFILHLSLISYLSIGQSVLSLYPAWFGFVIAAQSSVQSIEHSSVASQESSKGGVVGGILLRWGGKVCGNACCSSPHRWYFPMGNLAWFAGLLFELRFFFLFKKTSWGGFLNQVQCWSITCVLSWCGTEFWHDIWLTWQFKPPPHFSSAFSLHLASIRSDAFLQAVSGVPAKGFRSKIVVDGAFICTVVCKSTDPASP